MMLKIGVEYSVKTPLFEMKLFSNASKIFSLRILRACSRYLKVSRNIALCVSKNVVAVQHINEANSMETKNEVIFYGQNVILFVLFLKTGHLRYPDS